MEDLTQYIAKLRTELDELEKELGGMKKYPCLNSLKVERRIESLGKQIRLLEAGSYANQRKLVMEIQS